MMAQHKDRKNTVAAVFHPKPLAAQVMTGTGTAHAYVGEAGYLLNSGEFVRI